MFYPVGRRMLKFLKWHVFEYILPNKCNVQTFTHFSDYLIYSIKVEGGKVLPSEVAIGHIGQPIPISAHHKSIHDIVTGRRH